MAALKGWRFVGFISCFVGAVGLALYPVVVEPMLHAEKYKSLQKYTQAQREQLVELKKH